MSPLSVEVFHAKEGKWMEMRELNPGDGPSSIPNVLPNGRRNSIVYECIDNLKSVIREGKSLEDIDPNNWTNYGSVSSKVGAKELSDGESYEVEVRKDLNSQPAQIRFTHHIDSSQIA